MKFRPTAWWRMRISPGPGLADLDVDDLQFLGTAVAVDADGFAHGCCSWMAKVAYAATDCASMRLATPAHNALGPVQSRPMHQRLTRATALLLTRAAAAVGRQCGGRPPGARAGAADDAELHALAAGLRAAAAPRGSRVLRRDSPLWPHWQRFAMLGLLGIGCYNALQYLALQTSTPINVTLVGSSMPLWMLATGALFFGAAVTRRDIAGAAAVDARRAAGASAAATGSNCWRCGWCRAICT